MKPFPGTSAPRFHHVDGWSGWHFTIDPSTHSGLSVTRQGLTLARGALPSVRLDPPAYPAEARGLAIDHRGFLIAVREDRRGLCITTPCGPEYVPECWDLGGIAEGSIRGIASGRRGILYAALPEQGEVRALRFMPRGEFASVRPSRDPASAPTAVATDRQDRLYILDTGLSRLTIHRLEEDGVETITLPAAADMLAVSDSGAIAVASAGATSVWVRFAGESSFQERILRPLQPAMAFGRAGREGELLYVGDAATGRIIEYTLTSGENSEPVPMRWSSSAAPWSALLFRDGVLQGLHGDCAIDKVEFEVAGFFVRSAEVVLGPFDAKESATEWHRLIGDIEPGVNNAAGIEAQALAVDDCEAFDPSDGGEDARWGDYRRLATVSDGGLSELALRAAVGRHVYLRLKLYGDGRHAPILKWLRIEYPRDSYLRFLPAIYSEEPERRDITARFLSIFEAENANLGALIERLHLLFMPYAMPAEFMPWLAARLAFLLSPRWKVEQRREALGQVFQLYQRRGTRWALSRYLELYIGAGVRIVESFHARAVFILGLPTVLGCSSITPGSCDVPRMQLDRGIALGRGRIDSRPGEEIRAITEGRGEIWLFVPANVAGDPSLMSELHSIAELEAPAGTQLRIYASGRTRLGRVGRIGLDAHLGRMAPWHLAADGQVSTDADPMLLAGEPGGGRVGLGSGPPLGMDSSL